MSVAFAIRPMAATCLALLVQGAAGCGGAEQPPRKLRAPEAEPMRLSEPSARAEPTCGEALDGRHEKADALCREECEGGDAGICLALGGHHARGAPGIEGRRMAADFFEKACARGSDEGCWRGGEALRSTDALRSGKMLEQGCQADSGSEFARKSCHARGEVLAESGKSEDLEAALRLFERSCSMGHAPSCVSRSRVRVSVEAATAPLALEGKLVGKVERSLRIELDRPAELARGLAVEVHRHFESKPGQASLLGALGGILGATVSGWVVVASARTEKVEGNVATLTVLDERSPMTVNGKKVNHFSAGAKVKILVPRSSASE